MENYHMIKLVIICLTSNLNLYIENNLIRYFSNHLLKCWIQYHMIFTIYNKNIKQNYLVNKFYNIKMSKYPGVARIHPSTNKT